MKRPSSGTRLGEAYRLYSRPDSAAAQELAQEEERLLAVGPTGRRQARDLAARDPRTTRSRPDLPVPGSSGQDVALAAGLAAKGVTVAGIVQTICERATTPTRRRPAPPAPCPKARRSRSRTARSTRSCRGR